MMGYHRSQRYRKWLVKDSTTMFVSTYYGKLKHVMTDNKQNLNFCSHYKIRLTSELGQYLSVKKDC